LFEVFILKLLDVTLNTAKNAFFVRNKHLLASLLGASTTFIYFMLITKVLSANSYASIALVSLATFIGSYIPPIVIKHFEKDKVWIFDVTPPTNKEGRAFAKKMRSRGFPVVTYKSFNKFNQPVVCSKIFSDSKQTSREIRKLIPKSFKWHIVSAIN
jgi:uncharacterized protein YebE (UPF0316 family)